MTLPQRLRRLVLLAMRLCLALAYFAGTPSRASAIYLWRYAFWNPSGTADWQRFAQRTIPRSPTPAPYPRDAARTAAAAALLRASPGTLGLPAALTDLDTLLAGTGTTAFLVVHDGYLVRESYYNGHAREALTRAFSITKSATSLLVGVSLREALLRGLDEPVVRYLPELAGRGYEGVNLGHLLRMTAGLRSPWGRSPWAQSPLYYWHPQIRRLVLRATPPAARPDTEFQYNDAATCMLAVVLERAHPATLAARFAQHIWGPLGAEYDATWSLDRADGLENTASGLNARAIDLVKLGSLALNGGIAAGRRIVTAEWMAASVAAPDTGAPGGTVLVDGDPRYYQLGWWGHCLDGGRQRYWAEGHKGQLIYCCPDRRLVIARFGHAPGVVGSRWPQLLRELADRFPPVA